MLELTYGGDLSMVVVLPDDAADLPAVERKLARNYADWLAALRPTLVDLWLPRWTSRSRLDLGAELQAAGMRLAFSQSAADLSGIGDGPLSIDKVLQEAFIEVNETGTEAAAATFVGVHANLPARTGREAEDLPRRPPVPVFDPRPEDGGGAVLGAGGGVEWVKRMVFRVSICAGERRSIAAGSSAQAPLHSDAPPISVSPRRG